jgi:hypothetical protein
VSGGEMSVFFGSWLSGLIMTAGFLLLLWPLMSWLRSRSRAGVAAA